MISTLLSLAIVSQLEAPKVLETTERIEWTRTYLNALPFSEDSFKQLKKNAPGENSISAEDFEKIATNWKNDQAFIWSGSNVGKSSTNLRYLLKSAYHASEESSEILVTKIEFPSDLPKVEDTIKLIRANLLIAKLNPYEVRKANNAGYDEASKKFFESIGFVVIQDTKTQKFCSVPVVGQSLFEKHVLVLGLRGGVQTNFVDSFADEGANLRVIAKTRLLNAETLITQVSSLSGQCEWVDSPVLDIKKTRPVTYDLNYSVFKFLGAALIDPLNSQRRAILFRKTPSVRRNFDTTCGQSEDQMWLLFQTRDEMALGGRFYLEGFENKSPAGKAVAMSVSEVQFNAAVTEFRVYLWNRSNNKKALSLIPGFTPTSKSMSPDFINWLSSEITRDPY